MAEMANPIPVVRHLCPGDVSVASRGAFGLYQAVTSAPTPSDASPVTETDVPGHGDGGSSDPTKSRYDTHVVLPTGKPPPLLKTTVACVGAHALCWTATTPSPSVATHEMATRSDTNQLTALRITPTVRQAHHPAGRHRERDQPTTAVSLAPGQGFWIQDIHFLATKEDSHDA